MRCCVRLSLKDGRPFTNDRKLHMYATITAGGMFDASFAASQVNGLLIVSTFTVPHATVRFIRNLRASIDGSGATTSKAHKDA